MKKAYYDLHIHSCLSPCANDDMTPNNIVNMAKINGIDVIAITDHNSCMNCRAAIEVGESIGVCVIPGMEICTSEEIHAICLFLNVEKAEEFNEYVKSKSLGLKNKPNIFGQQLIMNSLDEIIGVEDDLLIGATQIGICELPKIVEKYDGIVFPAHIDRNSYSLLSVLGEFPSEVDFKFAELTYNADVKELLKQHNYIKNINLIKNSDSHRLENMVERKVYFELEETSINSVIELFDN